MNAQVPPALEAEIDALIGRYPQRRSATLMVLHALQEHFGCLPPETVRWTAAKLGLELIHVYELVTFYPMFRQTPAGKFHIKICRTLSCALGGSHDIHRHLCERLGLDPDVHGPQTTADGRFTVEFVECLAACDTAPVLTCNDRFHPSVTPDQADAILEDCQ
ncbi:MAG TPA: NAD(P)H-dependent oxidoreductase subunit E [Verrucomicrobiota bacterium]|nr:NAD(P)H-dependent oxidoreductase subunit E [Verrucomicrobiota bacterium]HNU51984.1 NAD(P)H-dependent oxidoreductase subunit E [Verrucomicrobiota bacterium]